MSPSNQIPDQRWQSIQTSQRFVSDSFCQYARAVASLAARSPVPAFFCL